MVKTRDGTLRPPFEFDFGTGVSEKTWCLSYLNKKIYIKNIGDYELTNEWGINIPDISGGHISWVFYKIDNVKIRRGW